MAFSLAVIFRTNSLAELPEKDRLSGFEEKKYRPGFS